MPEALRDDPEAACAWARRALALSDKEIIIGVKDNNLLSAFTSNVATVILIVGLAITGGLRSGLDAQPAQPRRAEIGERAQARRAESSAPDAELRRVGEVARVAVDARLDHGV